ncbi:MAG: HNH endonuclease [Candidatus Gastranaerophilaceae bacterium]
MNVQKVMVATPISTVANLKKSQNSNVKETPVVSNPIEATPSRVSQIMRNYFIGSQMVNPAFTGFPCSTSNFRVKQLEDMPCTCCGRPMMTNKQINKFVEDAASVSGKELNDVLENNIDYFRAEEKAIVHYIQKQLNGNNKNASLTTAVTNSNPDAEEILRDEQIDVIKRTIAKSKEILGENNIVNDACKKELVNKFSRNSKESFNRTNFLEKLVRLESQGVAHKDLHQILDVAVQLPESQKSIAKMLEYAYKGEEKFANRLIQKAVVTAEHIHPKSKGGPNATDNYMGECQECNSSRGNMSYDIWMKRYPNMPDNIQDNINAVTEEIVKGKIGGNYDDYPVDLKAAVYKETNGKVVLKVKNPEEINKMREERGLSKPVKDEKERANASGAYQGPKIGGPKVKPSGKRQPKHIADNKVIVRYPENKEATKVA